MKKIQGKTMKWFWFCIYFRYPVTAVGAISLFISNLFASESTFLWEKGSALWIWSMIYYIVLLVSAVGAIYYGYPLRKQALKYIFILICTNPVFSVTIWITMMLYYHIAPDTQSVSKFIAGLVFMFLEMIYFYKRIPVFFGELVTEQVGTPNKKQMNQEHFLACRWCGKYFVKGEQIAVCKKCESYYHIACVNKHLGCKCGSREFEARSTGISRKGAEKDVENPEDQDKMGKPPESIVKTEEPLPKRVERNFAQKILKTRNWKTYTIVAVIWSISLVVTAYLSSILLQYILFKTVNSANEFGRMHMMRVGRLG